MMQANFGSSECAVCPSGTILSVLRRIAERFRSANNNYAL